MYKISKNTFQILIKKETRGIKLTLIKEDEKKYFSVLKSGDVFLYDKKWVLLDTSTLKNNCEDIFEKGVSNLLQVIMLYKVCNERIKLIFDETLFLEALICDLYYGKIEWFPYGNEYKFEDSKLICEHEGITFEYEMPSKLGFKKDDFIKKSISHPIPLNDETTEETSTEE